MLSMGGLDAASAQTVEVFHAQDALFAENAGQWDTDHPDTGDWLNLPAGPVGCAAQIVPVPLPPDFPFPRPVPIQEVYFGYNKGGTQIYFTEESIEFGLSKSELKEGVEWDWLSLPEGPEGCAAQTVPVPLSPDGVDDDLYETTSTHFSLHFDGARPTVPTGADQAETVFNYHLGPQENWVDCVATYKRVVYDDLYAGIDLHTFSRHGEMKYEFHVAPGADWSEIQLSYDGIKGLSIGEDGSLCIETELGVIVDEGLCIYQTIGGEQVEVTGQFTVLDNNTYTFAVTGNYDPDVELVIDPEVDWSTYLGGANADSASGVATDASGNVYVTGSTESSGWVDDGWNTVLGGSRDGFVVKLNSAGAHLWSTYLGGANADSASGVATDASGNVYVTGSTESSDWVDGGWDTSFGERDDGFVLKLNSAGAHLWSSYLGGADSDGASSVATDASGNVYVAGYTKSGGWASGGWDTLHGGEGGRDGFVVKLNSVGAHLWSSYLGDWDWDYANGVATDASGNVYVAGYTGSRDWVSGGWNTSWSFNLGDGFIVKLDYAGAHLWSSYIGNTRIAANIDCATDVATDASGNVYVAGYTACGGWISGGWDQSYDGDGSFRDGFVVKLSSAGAHLWSSYLGDANDDWANGVATDASGNVYVAGSTESGGWVDGGWNTSFAGSEDGFVVKLDSAGAHLWSSYLGGADTDSANGVATDTSGNVYVAGETNSGGWVDGGWDTTHGGNDTYDGFLVKIIQSTPLPGDLNADSQVNSTDLDIIRANWGRAVVPGSLLDGDPSGDGTVNSDDLDIVRANWGAGAPTAAARTDSEDSTEAATPPLIGPRRASDSAFSTWTDCDAGDRPSDTDLVALAEAAWARERRGLREKA